MLTRGPKAFATATGQRQSVTLEDGTRVDLNARTSLRISMSGSERHVALASGEAYFQVAKDKSRPFFVETPAGSVRVTGTMFDVSSDGRDRLQVGVVEGSVQVHPDASRTYSLRPGDELTASASKVDVTPLSADSLEDALAWRTGEIVFHGAPLAEALERFASYHDVAITVSPQAREAGFTVGGRFSLDDLNSFLSGLPASFPVRVLQEGTKAYRVSLKSER